MSKEAHLSQVVGKKTTSFQFTNLTTDPFAISSLSVALLCWIIAFAGSIASALKQTFPRFTWWGLVFELMLMVLLFFFYCFDVVDQYKTFLTGGFAIAFVYTTNSATNLVYSAGSGKAAASAGVILLSMVNLIWIFYYGADNTSPINQWIDSFSLKGPRSSKNPFIYNHSMGSGIRYSNAPFASGVRGSTVSGQRYVSSHGLNGLENVSDRDNTVIDTPIYDLPGNEGTHISATTQLSGTNEFTIDSTLSINDFPYTARALYSYESSPDDENEISFEKGEILKVNDIHSRWWQAKRSNGEIGICPSNYVELIE